MCDRTHSLIDVLSKTRHSISRTRPGRFRILEYASLGADVWFIVQGARWNKDLLGIANFPWQGSSTLGTESASKALRSWKLVGFYLGAVTRPGEFAISDEEVARMAGARRFPAAGAVAMKKMGGLAGYYKLKRATKAGSFQGLLGHG